ncbi:CHAT domain-containing protein [Saccharopolyspora sp. NPDC002376]
MRGGRWRFIAAGATGVVGRWEVEDLPTAMFVIVFHHYLNSGYADPASAPRAAQLWMLDPRRRHLSGIPEELAAFSLTSTQPGSLTGPDSPTKAGSSCFPLPFSNRPGNARCLASRPGG